MCLMSLNILNLKTRDKHIARDMERLLGQARLKNSVWVSHVGNRDPSIGVIACCIHDVCQQEGGNHRIKVQT